MFRRREGFLLAAHLGEAFPHSEVRRLWALFQSGPLSLLSWVRGLSCGPLCATGISSGADGRVSRLRLTSPSAIAFGIPSLLWMSSAGSQSSGAVGCVSRPRSRTRTFSSISLFSCMRFSCNSSRFSLFFKFQVAWSGVRLVSFACSELEKVEMAGCLPPDSFKDWLSFVFWIPLTSDFTYATTAFEDAGPVACSGLGQKILFQT